MALGIDPAEAEKRATKLREEEEERKKQELEQKNLEAKLAFQRAVDARRKLQGKNKEMVQKLKEEVYNKTTHTVTQASPCLSPCVKRF